MRASKRFLLDQMQARQQQSAADKNRKALDQVRKADPEELKAAARKTFAALPRFRVHTVSSVWMLFAIGMHSDALGFHLTAGVARKVLDVLLWKRSPKR